MADLSPTAANVIAASDAVTEAGTLGATGVPADVVYKDSADGLLKLADNDGVTASKTPIGLLLNGGANGQPARILKSGNINLGAILTAGATYYLSNTAGKICPLADVGTGETVTIIGIAISTSVLKVNITTSGVTL